MNEPVPIAFQPPITDYLQQRGEKPLTVLSGPNNCGKTYILKHIARTCDTRTHFVGLSRNLLVDQIQTREIADKQLDDYRRNYLQRFDGDSKNLNFDVDCLDTASLLQRLGNPERQKLYRLVNDVLGLAMSLRNVVPDNEMTPFLFYVGDEKFSLASTGTRMLVTILAFCCDSRFDRLLIDEPEFGLSPKVQSRLARLFSDPNKRQEYMPHLKSIMIATHSHLFLDRQAIENNFIVTRSDGEIRAQQVTKIGDFHELQFNMLGNDLESLFMPSAIVIVEGKSDETFFKRALNLSMPGVRVAIVNSEGEGNVLDKLHTIKQAIGDLARSPYFDRIFVVFDESHGASMDRIASQGIKRENILHLTKNGIEGYYPDEIMRAIFPVGDSTLGRTENSNEITIGGVRKKKTVLAQEVADKMTTDTIYHPELQKLLSLIDARCR